MSLPTGRWYPPNRLAIEALLADLTREGRRRTAVFDWDDTTIFRCLGTATFRHAVSTLDLRLPPAAMAEVIRDRYGAHTHTADGIAFSALAGLALDAWETLWPQVRAGDAASAIARHPEAYRRFRTIAGALYERLEETTGPPFAYPYLVEILGNRSEAELAALTERAWAAVSQEAPQPIVWSLDTPAGPVRTTFEGGLALYEEMAQLAGALGAAGVDVHVVTASAEYAIAAGVRLTGFPIPRERVHGVRLVPDGERLSHRSPADWPLTWRSGKVDVIRRALPEPPVFVAGDTNTDFEMLTSFPETRLRLIINRDQQGPIRSLYALADEDGVPRTLLQGRDEGKRCLRPARDSI